MLDRDADPGWPTADVGSSGGTGTGRELLVRLELLHKLVTDKLVGPQQLHQPQKAKGVVLEGSGGQQQHSASLRRDLCYRPVRRIAGMTGPALQMMSFVDHQQIDAGCDRLADQECIVGQPLLGDDHPAVDVERIEVLSLVSGDVIDSLVVDQHKDLMMLTPELTEPLYCQSFGRNHQHPFRSASVDQAVHDQAGFDGLAEPDAISQQPAHRLTLAGCLGSMELMRVEPDPATEERAEPIGLAQLLETEGI
jgi:hypothetical protein